MVIRVDPSKAVLATVSYVEPEFNAQWLEVQVVAECSFPDVLGVDVVTPADLVRLEPIKNVSEAQAIADLYNHTFAKNPSEALSTPDLFSAILILIRSYADTATSTDATTIQTAKNLSDLVAGLEALAFSTSKPLADSYALPDRPAKEPQKLIKGIAQDYADPTYFAQNYVENDVVGDWVNAGNDIFTKEVTYGRNAGDDLASSDALQPFQFGKGLRDTVISQEYREIASTKSMPGDFLNAIDNMDGNIQYQVVKVVGELSLLSDSQVVDNSKQKADNILTTDTGFILVQDYVEPGYFMQDYAGFGQSF